MRPISEVRVEWFPPRMRKQWKDLGEGLEKASISIRAFGEAVVRSSPELAKGVEGSGDETP